MLKNTAIFIVVLLFLIMGLGHEKDKTILIVGDSLSTGLRIDRNKDWVSLLEQRLDDEDKPYLIVNASLNGNTTQAGLRSLPELIERYKPDIIIIALGGNDGLRQHSIERISDNIESMIQITQQHNARVLLCGLRLPPRFNEDYRESFVELYHDISQSNKVALVPFILAGVDDNESMMNNDGIHPNQRAQPVILENVWTGLKELL